MISLHALQVIAAQALSDAKSFLTEYTTSRRFCSPQNDAEHNARIPDLKRFVYDLTGATIHNYKLPYPNYASWLFAVNVGNTAIYLDQQQMISWMEQTGMPCDVQQIRSIIHELGHILLHHRLLECPANQFVNSSYPEDTENSSGGISG